MNLGAFFNIGNLKPIAKANGIDVPCLRGYWLMKNKKKLTNDDISEMCRDITIEAIEKLIASNWKELPYREYSIKTTKRNKHYLNDTDFDKMVIRWDRIHGKKRKIAKWECKKSCRNVIRQMNMFNKYAGRDDVLYIHARLGNWLDIMSDIKKKSWYLESINDSFDSSYCDIYAKIASINYTGVDKEII